MNPAKDRHGLHGLNLGIAIWGLEQQLLKLNFLYSRAHITLFVE